jgi:hypothetical protein
LDYGLREILRSHGTGEKTNGTLINIASNNTGRNDVEVIVALMYTT